MLKSWGFFLAGCGILLMGLAALIVAIQRPAGSKHKWIYEHPCDSTAKRTFFSSGSTPLPSTSLPVTDDKPNAVKLKESEMLLVKSPKGKALIDFINFGDREGTSTYRWRFLPSSGERELTGEGEVFERYESETVGIEDYEVVKDIGSRLFVEAGPLKIEWSYASPSSGWLYVEKDEIEITTIPDTFFSSYKLKK